MVGKKGETRTRKGKSEVEEGRERLEGAGEQVTEGEKSERG